METIKLNEDTLKQIIKESIEEMDLVPSANSGKLGSGNYTLQSLKQAIKNIDGAINSEILNINGRRKMASKSEVDQIIDYIVMTLNNAIDPRMSGIRGISRQ